MSATYYLSPFLNSHALHLIIGPKAVGKTTYTLQMLGLRPPDEDQQESTPWSQFERGQLPQELWYVDLIKPRKAVLEHVVKMGLGEGSQTARTLRVITYDQIIEHRPEQNRKDPITFSDVMMKVSYETGGRMPPILIIDGFMALLSVTAKDQAQAHVEQERLREIDRAYLSAGGCLIGIQTYTRHGRTPSNAIELPGSPILANFAGSITELAKKKDGTKVTISGNLFPQRSMLVEFDKGGRLQIATPKEDSATQPVRLATDPEIAALAIELSVQNDTLEFSRSALLEAAAAVKLERWTVDRWLERNRRNRTVLTIRYGVYTLNPKPLRYVQ